MLAIAGQTAGSNGLTFFKETLEYPGGVKKTKKINLFFVSKFDFSKFHGQRRPLQLVIIKY